MNATPAKKSPTDEATRLLRHAWLKRGEFWSEDIDEESVLRDAPEIVADKVLGYQVEYCQELLSDRPTDRGIVTAEVAGILNRRNRLIQISKIFPPEVRRFTLAHEIGHIVLHPGLSLHRDRSIGDSFGTRPAVEREADAFAAEFLMPRKLLGRTFAGCFCEPIDGRYPNNDLAWQMSIATGKQWNSVDFARLALNQAITVAFAAR